MKFKWKKWAGTISIASYRHDNSEAWLFQTEDGEPIATLTVMLEDVGPPPPGCLYIKDWSENEGVLQALVEHGYVFDTGHRIPTGYVEAALVVKLADIE